MHEGDESEWDFLRLIKRQKVHIICMNKHTKFKMFIDLFIYWTQKKKKKNLRN